MGLKRKIKGEKGSAVIIMVATLAILGVVGYVLGTLMARHQESIPTNMDSARAFAIAQSGVEFVGKYLEGRPDYTTVSTPPTMTLGSGTFSTAFSGVTSTRLDATITGVSGTATRRITVRYQKKGGAIMSRGPINPMNNPNGSVVCDATVSCNTATIHTCECTREYVPASVLPTLPVPSPQPAAIPAGGGGCTVANNSTVTVPAGTYYCSTYRIRNNTTVNLGGVVVIYCDTFSIENSGVLNWGAGSQAANLVIIASSGATIGQNVNMKGAVYAPGANVTMDNSSTITGMLVGNVVGVSNQYTVNYDPNAGVNTPAAPYLGALADAIDWRDI